MSIVFAPMCRRALAELQPPWVTNRLEALSPMATPSSPSATEGVSKRTDFGDRWVFAGTSEAEPFPTSTEKPPLGWN